MNAKKIFMIIIIILFLILLLQNTQVVTLRLLFWKISMSQIILIPIILLLGFALGYLTAYQLRRQKDAKSSIDNSMT